MSTITPMSSTADLVRALPGQVVKGFRVDDRVSISLDGITATGTIVSWYPASITLEQKVRLDGTGVEVKVPESIMEKI